MTKTVMLDSGPLGRIAHPRPNREIVEWLERLLGSGVVVIVPEIADYEVRRNSSVGRPNKISHTPRSTQRSADLPTTHY